MNNPYKILNVKQNANNADIHKALLLAMKQLKSSGYSLAQLQSAAKQLLDPAKRLAADFMYPAKIKAKRPHPVKFEYTFEKVNIKDIDPDVFNSI